jgi:signal transduction histidine kinase
MRIVTEALPGYGQGVAATASGDAVHTEVVNEQGRASGARILTELSVLVLSTPLLLAFCATANVSHAQTLRIAVVWSVVQMVILVWVVHGHVQDWAEARVHAAEAESLGRRAAIAEETVRREEERLHELRTTVSGIGLTHRLLSERTADLPLPTRTRLEGLYESELTRLQHLVDDETPQPIEALHLGALLDPLVEALRLRGHRIAWTGSSATAMGRRDDVLEVVQGLLENASRHAPGSDVAVTVSTTDDHVRIGVSDYGPGVPVSLRQRLFERGERRSESPGDGLGLHIARRLARQMGGDLWLEPGRSGAGFVMRLPLAAQDTPCLARAE